MTSKKGSLWKTSWGRRSALGYQQLAGEMWFFDLLNESDGAYYRYVSAAPNPFVFANPVPFWWGAVFKGANTGAMKFACDGVNNGVDGVYTSLAATDSAPARAFLANVVSSGLPNASFTSVELNYLLGQVVAVLFTAVDLGDGNVRIHGYCDRLYLGYVDVLGYIAQTGVFSLYQTGDFVGSNVHGFVGGTGTPTEAQIDQWFADTKANFEIAEIAGMTTDRFSATSVQPLVPAVLPNQVGGGQDLDLTAFGAPGAASNTLLPAYFNY
jgi:hypothetical protein